MFTSFRFALRGLRRNPGWLAAAILSFALGSGANTAVFCVIESALLRPLPVRDPASLAVLWETNPKISGPVSGRLPVADFNFVAWRTRLQSFEQIEALRRSVENFTGDGPPESVVVARVTPGFFRLLGRSPASGGVFHDEAPVAVLSAKFSARHSGRKLILNGQSYSLAGVMPADFHLPALRQGMEEILPDIWLPMPARITDPLMAPSRRNYIFARLRPGHSIPTARAELAGLARQLAGDSPRMDAGFGAAAYLAAEEDANPSLCAVLFALQAAAAVVLLIACANLALLLLTRATARARETAIRAALGATPGQILQGPVAESLATGVIGAALGLVIAQAAVSTVDALAPDSLSRLHHLALNWRVLGFSLLVNILATLLFSLAPAWAAASANPRQALTHDGRSGEGRGALRLRGALAAAEAAFAVVLLSAAGFTIRATLRILAVDPGFRPDHVLTLRVQLPLNRYPSPADQTRFCNRLLTATASLRGVRSAALATTLPVMDSLAVTPYRCSGQAEPLPGEQARADFKAVSEDYFAATGTPVLRGRTFTREDALAAQPGVIVINQALAEAMPSKGDPIGQSLIVGSGPKTIVGVVASAHQQGAEIAQRPEMFFPTRSFGAMALLLRTEGDPRRLAQAATAAVSAIDPDQPVSNVRTLEEQMLRGAAQPRLAAALFGIFAALALLLATVGLYGVISCSVALRAREFGIRIALGATPAAILRLALGGALRITLIGIAAGALGSFALTPLLRNSFFGFSASGPAGFLISAAALLAAAAAAAFLPASRAARLQPGQTLNT